MGFKTEYSNIVSQDQFTILSDSDDLSGDFRDYDFFSRFDATWDGGTTIEYGRSVAVGAGKILVGAPDDASGYAGGQFYMHLIDIENEDSDALGTQDITYIGSGVGQAGDFGDAVAIGCGKIAVGAQYGDTNTRNTHFTTGLSNKGHMAIYDTNVRGYVPIFNSGAYKEYAITDAYVQSPDAINGGDGFAYKAIAIGCGRIVVGEDLADDTILGGNVGQWHIFDLDGNHIHTERGTVSSNQLGNAVAIGCGRIVVGESQATVNDGSSDRIYAGRVHIYDLNGYLIKTISARTASVEAGIPSINVQSSARFGYSVAVGFNRIVVGSNMFHRNGYFDNGLVYIFDIDGNYVNTLYQQEFATTASSQFGTSVAVANGRIYGSCFDKAHVTSCDLDGNNIKYVTGTTAVSNGSGVMAAADGTIIMGEWNYSSQDGAIHSWKNNRSYDIKDFEKHCIF